MSVQRNKIETMDYIVHTFRPEIDFGQAAYGTNLA